MAANEKSPQSTEEELRRENEDLRARNREFLETLDAIRLGEVDAIVIAEGERPQVYTLEGADYPYRVLVENIQEGALTLTSAGTILYANASFVAMRGEPLAAILGAALRDQFNPRDRAQLDALLAASALGPCRGEMRICSGTGSFSVQVSLTPVAMSGEAKISVVVTDRRQDYDRLRLLARMLDSVADAVTTVDPDGTIVYWNEAAERLYGWKVSEMVGQPLADRVDHGIPEDEALRIADLMAAGKVWLGEYMARHRNGRNFPVQATRAPVYDEDGVLVGVIATSRDITERKQAEEALQRQNEELGAAEEELRCQNEELINGRGGAPRAQRRPPGGPGAPARERGAAPGSQCTCQPRTGPGQEPPRARRGHDPRARHGGEGHPDQPAGVRDPRAPRGGDPRKGLGRDIPARSDTGGPAGRLREDNRRRHQRVRAQREPGPHPDGEERHILWSNRLITDDDGRIAGILSSGEDITERKRAEEAVRESERRQAFLLALGDALRGLGDIREIAAVASEMVGRHLGVNGVAYCEMDPAGRHPTVQVDWTDGTVPSTAGSGRMDGIGALAPSGAPPPYRDRDGRERRAPDQRLVRGPDLARRTACGGAGGSERPAAGLERRRDRAPAGRRRADLDRYRERRVRGGAARQRGAIPHALRVQPGRDHPHRPP